MDLGHDRQGFLPLVQPQISQALLRVFVCIVLGPLQANGSIKQRMEAALELEQKVEPHLELEQNLQRRQELEQNLQRRQELEQNLQRRQELEQNLQRRQELDCPQSWLSWKNHPSLRHWCCLLHTSWFFLCQLECSQEYFCFS